MGERLPLQYFQIDLRFQWSELQGSAPFAARTFIQSQGKRSDLICPFEGLTTCLHALGLPIQCLDWIGISQQRQAGLGAWKVTGCSIGRGDGGTILILEVSA